MEDPFVAAYRKRMRDYYHANKERIREQQKKYEKVVGGVKHECECGGRYTTKNIQKHLSSAKHQEFVKASKNKSQ